MGNAVPPPLARAIGLSIKRAMLKKEATKSAEVADIKVDVKENSLLKEENGKMEDVDGRQPNSSVLKEIGNREIPSY